MKKLSAVREENGCREFFIVKQTIIGSSGVMVGEIKL